VGAWGSGLFSDDTACDVRDRYQELIASGTQDAEAKRLVLAEVDGLLADPNEAPTAILALAVTQSEMGRLDPDLLERALMCLDRGDALDRWSDDPVLLSERQDAMAAARRQLLGPQPPRSQPVAPDSALDTPPRGTALEVPVPGGVRYGQVGTPAIGEAPWIRVLPGAFAAPLSDSELADLMRGATEYQSAVTFRPPDPASRLIRRRGVFDLPASAAVTPNFRGRTRSGDGERRWSVNEGGRRRFVSEPLGPPESDYSLGGLLVPSEFIEQLARGWRPQDEGTGKREPPPT
jgi:hypothetical protein